MIRSTSALFLAACASAVVACRAAPAAPEGRTVVDGLGRSVSLPRAPLRVVSLAPGVTDSLFALGFGDRVVGVSDFCQPPPEAGPIARVGGMLNPSLETIRSLRPDLIVGTSSGNDPSFAGQAEALALPFYALHTPDVDATLRALTDLAAVLGDRSRGEALAAELQGRLREVRARVAGRPPPRLLFIVWGEPLVVPGRPSYLTDAMARAGGQSVTADAPIAWPTFEVEAAIARAPEVILTGPQNLALARRLWRDPAWSGVPAVRQGRIYVISEEIQKPGPAVVAGIEELARVLHPDAFGPPTRPEAGATKQTVRASSARTVGGSGRRHPSAPPQER
jgi:iron complex transport system substrate-binding protein